MVRSLQISPKELSAIHQDGVQRGLTISRRERPAENPPPGGNPGNPPWPGYPNPMPPGKDWPVKFAGMPPDLNTPWLPGGQKTDGIPNITNPKLKKKLQQNKGIKGSDPELFPLADASALTDYLDSKGRNPRTGSFKGTPLGNDPEKLIETLLIGAQKFKA